MSKVLIEVGYPLGDCIAAMPYINKYVEESKDDVVVWLQNSYHQNLFRKSFPSIKYTTDIPSADRVIKLLHVFDKSIQGNFANQLGYDNAPYIRPKVDSFKMDRPIKNKYVVIGIHSTAQLKYWNHPGGKKVQGESPYWNELCDMFRKAGITPVITEKHETYGVSPYRNGMPKKAQKKLGLSLMETANYIEHAEFFIGLSSGLAWLAHGLGQKVAMIANFTEHFYEFGESPEDYVRISNHEVCHGCWNKVGNDLKFDSEDWYWCPFHKDTPRQFECHTSITPSYVFTQIKKWL